MMTATTYSTRASRLLPSHPLPARRRARGIVADGPGPPAPQAHARPALLAAARHGAGRDDDAQRRPQALGAVRRLGGRGGTRRLPRGLAGDGALALARRRELHGPAGPAAL